MNSKREDEDYWQSSKLKPFSFDEKEFSYKSTLFDNEASKSSRSFHRTFDGRSSSFADIVFQGIPTVEKDDVGTRPLGTLISKHSLTKILGDITPTRVKKPNSLEEEVRLLRRQIENQWTPPPALKTIKLILTGQPYSFHLYRSLDQKKELIDEAIKAGDGNSILAVLLFLSKSLKKSVFYQILQDRPTAVAQYVQYLSTRHLIAELIDLLSMLGQTKEAAVRHFKVTVQSSQNLELKLKKLNSCYYSHFSASDSKDKPFINNFIKYLEWLIAVDGMEKGIPSNSTLSSLSYLCKNHWNEEKTSNLSPSFFTAQQGISDRQFQWTTLCTLSSIQAWDDLQAFFLTKGWISGIKLKGVLSIEKVVQVLHRQDAPNHVIAEYLAAVDNVDKRLDISKELTRYSLTVDIYVAMKDRQGLTEFKANLKPQSEEYIYAEKALNSPVKWKN